MSNPMPWDGPADPAPFPDGFWVGLRRELSVAMFVVAAAVCVGTCLAMNEALRNPLDTSGWAYVGIGAPAVTGAWLALEQIWRPSPIQPLGRFMLRQLAFGFTFVAVNAVVHVIVERDAAAYGVRTFPDYRTPTTASNLANAIAGFDLIGAAASLVGGTAILVLVVIPLMIARSPREYAKLNALSTSDEDLASARAGGIAMVVLIVLVVAVPTLIVVGNANDSALTRWIGILLVPGLLVLTLFISMFQQVDKTMSPQRRLMWWKH